MHDEPKIEHESDVHYVAIRKQLLMREMGSLPPLWREVKGWLEHKGLAPNGAPIWVYRIVDMDATMEIDVGFPVASPVEGDDRVVAGVLPEGRYVTMLYKGSYDGLMPATADLLAWGDQRGVVWDKWPSGATGEGWKARTEFYLTDDRDNPDPATWETRLEFKLADQ